MESELCIQLCWFDPYVLQLIMIPTPSLVKHPALTNEDLGTPGMIKENLTVKFGLLHASYLGVVHQS